MSRMVAARGLVAELSVESYRALAVALAGAPRASPGIAAEPMTVARLPATVLRSRFIMSGEPWYPQSRLVYLFGWKDHGQLQSA